jgi:RNA polymerase sigma-70 factor (ECF subfamily)
MDVMKNKLYGGGTFEQLYAEYYEKVYIYIYHRVNNRHDAEDLTAEVFLKAFASPYDPRVAKFSTYIYTIAGNTLKNHYRAVSKKIRLFSPDEPDEHISDEVDILGDLITREEYQGLRKGLAALPERQYEVLYRRYYLELPFKAIGLALGITEDAAKKVNKRALESLKKILNKERHLSRG